MSNLFMLIAAIFLPLVFALISLILRKHSPAGNALTFMLAAIINFCLSIVIFGEDISILYPWSGLGVDFALRVDALSSFVVLIVAIISLLISLYSVAFTRYKTNSGLFNCYFLITISLLNGAVLAANMILMLIFVISLLFPLLGFVMLGGRTSSLASLKTLIINGIADICLFAGAIITVALADSTAIEFMAFGEFVSSGYGTAAFILISLGIAGKLGAMPFHSWIPSVAKDAPLPFIAAVPGILQKVLGIYLFLRLISSYNLIYNFTSPSALLMILGVVTIIIASFMSLSQRNMKRMLAYLAVVPSGFVLVALGTALPTGITGGISYLISSSVCLLLLFLTAGAVERQTGTTDLKKLGGLSKYMPFTTVFFIISAASLLGVPLLSGFFPLVYIFDAAMSVGVIYYIFLLLGILFSATALIKLVHSVFFGHVRSLETEKTQEAPWAMRLPMLLLALSIIVLGIFYRLPYTTLVDYYMSWESGPDFLRGLYLTLPLLAVWALAYLNHRFGVKKTGSGFASLDHILKMPLLRQIYVVAQEGYLDPYNILMTVVKIFSWAAHLVNNIINWIYDVLIEGLIRRFSAAMGAINDSPSVSYTGWILSGLAVVIIVFMIWV